MIAPRVSLVLIVLLLVVRAVMAAALPLSADEAYYWLWSRHLAAGYFDHPPMTAWLIRAGTALFGNTPLGVRAAGIVLSLPASALVWRAAALVLRDEGRAGLAALLFNLTLMASVELLAATPDMASVVAAAATVYGLAKIAAGGDRRWWLAVGAAIGLGLLAKFSALFLVVGILVWLLLERRAWLASPWPWAGAAVALVLFAPNLWWQSHHGWETFAFQFGRVGSGPFTPGYVAEFFAGQLALATPLIFLLMVLGLWRASRVGRAGFFLAVLAWTGIGYFLLHALHDRVQGNWPAFLYPALAILAAQAWDAGGRLLRWVSVLAAPLAAMLLALAYAQAAFGIVSLRKDPVAHLLGRDFHPVAEVAAALVKTHLADAILTTDYQTTAWLRFTEPNLTVVQVNESFRFEDAPPAPATMRRPIYLAELKRDQHQLLKRDFGYLGFPTQIQTGDGLFMLYPVAQPRHTAIGKMP